MSRIPLKDMQLLLERATYVDDYGVEGSTFMGCRICGRESGAGLLARPNWHAPNCPVPRLKRKYSERGAKQKGSKA